MDHTKYHSLRRAAVDAALDRGDYGALAAVTALGEKMYFQQDWEDWSCEERTIYGMFLTLSLQGVDASAVKESRAWTLAVAMTSEPEATAVARVVWENFE